MPVLQVAASKTVFEVKPRPLRRYRRDQGAGRGRGITALGPPVSVFTAPSQRPRWHEEDEEEPEEEPDRKQLNKPGLYFLP